MLAKNELIDYGQSTLPIGKESELKPHNLMEIRAAFND